MECRSQQKDPSGWSSGLEKEKLMSAYLDETVEALRKKSNDELVNEFTQHVMSAFPHTIVLKALEVVMEERKIVMGMMVMGINYTENGEAKFKEFCFV